MDRDAFGPALAASAARVLAHHRRRFRPEMEEGDPEAWSFKEFWTDDPPPRTCARCARSPIASRDARGASPL